MSEAEKAKYLSIEDIVDINRKTIELHGGGSFGIRYPELLESAAAQPAQNVFGLELHATIPEKAAAYLFYLNQSHCFENGNKRTALATAMEFLERNGHELTLTKEQAEKVAVEVASGQLQREQLSQVLADSIRQRNPVQQIEAQRDQGQGLDPVQVAAVEKTQSERPAYRALPGQSAEDHAREMQELMQKRLQQPEPQLQPIPEITRGF